MLGFGNRDRAHGCEAIHDDIFVRALFLEHEGEEVLIMGFDLCFLGREEADRYKGAIGRRLDLRPSQILLNTSHSHVGPAVGTWAYADYRPPDRLYLGELESATVRAACRAHGTAREVTLWAGSTQTTLPMSRRRRSERGTIEFRPNPGGVVYDGLPVCLFKDFSGAPVSLLFSVACHPSTTGGFQISAEYPGVAMSELDRHLGRPGSLFLQGAGGDAKPCVIGQGTDHWRQGTWEDVERAGRIVAGEVLQTLVAGLAKFEPDIRTAAVEMEWPLRPAVTRAECEAILADPTGYELKRLWAARQIERLDRGQQLATSVPITAHAIQLGRGIRLIGLEGEPVAGLGLLIRDYYGAGVTFALGYCNGAQLYLPTEAMLEEGGYEVESYYEYGFPAALAHGFEGILLDTLARFREKGVE